MEYLYQVVVLVIGTTAFQTIITGLWKRREAFYGKKRTKNQLLELYRERLAIAKHMAVEAGVECSKLPKDPMLFPKDNDF